MSRPFPNTFDQDSAMSPQSISYKANVNRQKTKKWQEAKPADYGGDDWGDEDDEYDLPPPPVSKPTGLRQQGQGLPNSPPPVDNGKKAYGGLPALPSASAQRERSNSFDADEERNFSNATARQPSPPIAAAPPSGPARSFSQITGAQTSRGPSGPPPLSISTQQPPSATGLRKPINKIISPIAESPQYELRKPERKNTGEAPSLASSSVYSPTPTSDTRTPSDYQARRDYSPSAAPPPLDTRGSPAPQGPDAAGTTFPARKSSLSQVSRPDVSTIMQRPREASNPRPWADRRTPSPGPAAQSPTSPSKALPFIRPADIYRRAEEERQSMESGRPSMDSILGTRNTDSAESTGKPYLRERSSSDSLGTGSRRRANSGAEDGLDAGRRLMPMLEPVRERKSEYGFDGFNVSEQGPRGQTKEPHTSQVPEVSDATKLDVEEARRQSVSPKLPDLNRLSGFGMDMFSRSKPQETEASVFKGNESTWQTSTAAPATSGLEDEPTLHNQPSVGFRSVVHQAFDRTDDSSVPPTPASRSGSGVRRTDSESTGTTGISPIMSRVTSSAAPNNGNQDFSTPSIPEAVNEHSSPEPAIHQPQPVISGFKPGHRRDISTPSPGNSPARTPDVARSDAPIHGQEVVITDPSPTSTVDDEPLHPQRPTAEREATFRPSLPGGWTSYATTERASTPTQADQQIIDGIAQTPVGDVPTSGNNTRGDYDMNPTTTKHSLPQSALEATLVGATVGAGARGKHDNASLSGTPRSESPEFGLGNDNLPTPDPAMAPGGNVYSTTTLDPRLLPALEKAPQETQLRPDVVNRPVSAETSDAPPLPTKDTPRLDSARENSGYFPSPNVNILDQVAAEGYAHSISQPHILPRISTDDSHDDVNEKLEKDIVRSLSPRPSDADRLSNQFDDGASYGQSRESSYLPREYDNYWASSNEDHEPIPPVAPISIRSASTPGEAPIAELEQKESDAHSIQPLSPRKVDQTSFEPDRAALQHRYSWEGSKESVPLGPSGDISENVSATAEQVAAAKPSAGVESQPTSDHTGRDAAFLAGARNSLEPKSRRLSLAEEKDPLLSSYPISPTPPEEQHPARYSQTHVPLPTDQHSPINSPLSHSGPILSFSQIVAIKSVPQRIQTFDETRHRFAAIDSGLNDWITALKAQEPEHADVTGSWGGSRVNMPSASARTKFGKVTGTGAQPTQQPYYQQYLNATSPNTPSAPISRPGPSMGPNSSQQGFSPVGGKITSHQVQAKGKEFLHTAGVFGGKAGKAGKGLLAKGKSRLRAAGGGDKTSPETKPKNEHRTSWGLPLRMSGSSGRDSQQNVKQFGEGSRANTVPQRASAPPQFSLPSIDTSGNMDRHRMEAPHTVDPHTSREGELFTSREKTSEDKIEAQDESRDQPSWFLNPTPVAEEEAFHWGEHSNSMEHATPPVPSIPTYQEELLSAPYHTGPASERGSNEISFYDASEGTSEPLEPVENNDWVMVSPEQELTNMLPQQSRDDPLDQNGSEPSHVPSPSILNRPRGSTIKELAPPLPTNPTATSSPAMTPTVTQSASRAEPPKQGDSSFLPPIRRTSTFGIGFGPRQKKPRFAIDDEDETSISSMDKSGSEALGSEVAAIGTATTARGIAARDVGRPRPDSETWPQEESPRILHKVSVAQLASQPDMPFHNETREDSYQQPVQTEPSNNPQGTTLNREPEQYHEQFSALPAAHLPVGSRDPRSSEESWGLNSATSSQAPPTQWSDSTIVPSRTSWDPQRKRGMSGSSQNLPRSNSSFIDRPPLAGSSSQIKSFEQPPSSASRYPDLFRPEQPLPTAPGMYGDAVVHAGASDLPSHLYQQPIPREDAFLPRQQGAEYQIEGVGPPVDEPSSGRSRRNSGFFRELGGRISRGTSRERGNSISREDGFPSAISFESPENDYVEPSIASEEGKEKKHKKQRSSFMGHLTRASTGVLGTPKTRESMVTHPSGSRVDLTASKQAPSSKGQTHPQFENSPIEPKQLERAATSVGPNAEPGKKKRFSSLTGFFARPGNSPRASLSVQARQKPQNIRKVSYNEQQSIVAPLSDPRKAPSPPGKNVQPQTYPPSNYRPPTSPNYPARSNNYQPLASDHYQPPSPKRVPPATATRVPSQSRNIFSVLASNNNASSSPDSRKDNKKQTHRPSPAGLLNEFMGRKSKPLDGDRDDSHSQGSQSQLSQSQSGRQALPRAQTYTDLQEREQEMEPPQQSIEQPKRQPAPQKQKSASRQDSSHQDRDRSRRISREPQYDSVPIPGGYSLVRGQGAMTAPTEYDPRGFNRAPQPDPRYGQPQNWPPNQYPSPPTQGQPQQYFNGQQYQSPSPQQYNDRSQFQKPSPQHTIPSMPSNGQETRHAAPTLAIESFDHSTNPSLSRDLSFSPPSHPEIQPSERRPSRDLARSPARAQEGQQPPYQLSLPGDTSADEDEKPPPISKDDPIIITPLSSPPKHSSIKRLQQPIIQHPGSPASYAIPESTFSPVNPGAVDMPPPPPPKSPPGNLLDAQYRPAHTHTLSADESLNLSLDLDRSNTHRTAVSAVSVMSSPSLPPDSAGLTVPNINEHRGLDGSPSPSPPTPDFERGRRHQRGTSREAQGSEAGTIVQTVLETPAVSDHDDIYDASPRLPKLVTAPTVRAKPPPVSPTRAAGAGPGPGPSNLGNGKENGSGSGRPVGKENEHTAELDNTDQERYRVAREEKIFYDGGVSEETEPTATMSATSYPGQEWNPYSGVAVDDLNWYE